MKTWYDKKAKRRQFKVGDKVLALLPVPTQPLQARYLGPYVIAEKVNEVDYIVNTPGRRKAQRLCHINMLKEYHQRPDERTADQEVTSTPMCIAAKLRTKVRPGTLHQTWSIWWREVRN